MFYECPTCLARFDYPPGLPEHHEHLGPPGCQRDQATSDVKEITTLTGVIRKKKCENMIAYYVNKADDASERWRFNNAECIDSDDPRLSGNDPLNSARSPCDWSGVCAGRSEGVKRPSARLDGCEPIQ